MDNNYSSTGVNNLKSDKPRQSLIFTDNTCPICGDMLLLDSKPFKNGIINVRFICKNCKFICPIYHDESDPNKLSPKYDSSISEFIENLGETINDTRVRMLKEQ